MDQSALIINLKVLDMQAISLILIIFIKYLIQLTLRMSLNVHFVPLYF